MASLRSPWAYSIAAVLLLAPGCGDDSSSNDGEEDGSGSSSGVDDAGPPPTTSGAVDSSTGEPPAGFCEGATALVYEPLAKRLDAYPDDVFTVDDFGATGVRV